MVKTSKEGKQHKMFKEKTEKKKQKAEQEANHQDIMPQTPKQKKAHDKNKELRETGNSSLKRFCNKQTVQIRMTEMG